MSVSSVWQEIRHWPPEEQRELAARILQSLPSEVVVSPAKERKEALNSLIGIWRIAGPPDDETVDRIVEEERLKKHS